MISSAESFQIDAIAISVADIRTMILLLGAPESDAIPSVLEWVIKFAEQSPKNRLNLLSLKIVPLLLKLSSSKSGTIRKLVASCVAAISEMGEVHAELRNKDLIQRLVAMLSTDENVEVQDPAALAVGQIAKDFSNKVEIRKVGGMKALLKLMLSTDPDVKKNAAFALNVLLDDYASRTELRLLNGFPNLLDLLHADHTEIVENSLHCLIRCSEDGANRTEIRKAQGLKKLLSVLDHTLPSVVVLALHCISNCLEDVETNISISEYNGIAQIVALMTNSDIKVKSNAESTLYKIAKQDRNIGYAREAGALAALLININVGGQNTPVSATEYSVISNAALAISSMARNEMNQNDLLKANAVETLLKLLTMDNADIKKNALLALSQLSNHSAKVRAKMRVIDGIKVTLACLQSALTAGKDMQLITNAIDCVSSLAEDAPDRAEITKLMGIQLLATALRLEDHKLLATTAMALARILQDADARVQFYEVKGHPHMFRLLGSTNDEVCRNTAWALSNAALLEPIAHEACNLGALENLLSLSKSPTRNIAQFATDALEKILDFHLPAKYWLRNVLAAENQIRSGFYDVGSSGSNSEHLGGFPTLEALLSSPIDKKREIVWVNCEKDADLEKLIATIVREVQDTVQPNQSATSGAYPSFARVTALRIIAKRVAEHMGGVRAQQAGKNSDDFGYKFHIAEMKVTRGSNVLPLGCIRQGTFYHRALAFKVIADLLLHTDERKRPSSGKPAVGANFVDVPVFSEMRALGTRVALTRGEYGRAWNSVQLKPYEVLDADSFKATAGNLGVLAAKEEEYVVDLMFQPGALIKSTSVEAEAYRRISE